MEDLDLDLPATQTQEDYVQETQDLVDIQKPWGRLLACMPALKSVDLFEKTYTFGRAPHCNIFVEKSQFPEILNVSKVHFQLCKEDDVICLIDHSKNGTFINSVKIGKNKKHIIYNDDIIAVGHPKMKVFYLSCNQEDEYLPQEMRHRYVVSRLLGKGAFGEVRLAHEKSTFKEFAIKKIHKARSSLSASGQGSLPQKIKTEVEILTSFSYAFIIQMREVFETERDVFLVLEYMKGGVLTGRILSAKPLPESEIKFIFYQILQGVRYLHLNGVTHRDLKPENVLLSSNNQYPLVKISDFGLSKVMDDISLMETICGTINYAAPEILNCVARYDRKVDVWSLGVILFYMLSRAQPFSGSTKEEIARNIRAGNITWDQRAWKVISFPVRNLVKSMITVDVERRSSIIDVFKHEWIERDVTMRLKVEQLLLEFDGTSSEDTLIDVPLPKRQRLSSVEHLT